jgi:hypothetical protein
VLKATIVGVVLLFAAEEVRYSWRRAGRGVRGAVADFEHRRRDDLLRRAFRFLAGELLSVGAGPKVSTTGSR